MKNEDQLAKTHVTITNERIHMEQWKNKKIKRKCKYLKGSGGEFNSNSRFGLQTKLVSSKPGKDVRFSNTRISDQNDLEQVIILMIHSMRHGSSPLRSLKPTRSNFNIHSDPNQRRKKRTARHYNTQIKTKKNETDAHEMKQ